jgi:hypothetical protein
MLCDKCQTETRLFAEWLDVTKNVIVQMRQCDECKRVDANVSNKWMLSPESATYAN